MNFEWVLCRGIACGQRGQVSLYLLGWVDSKFVVD